MANALKTLFFEIAQAIRDQNGDPPEVKYKPVEFPQKIADISGGGGTSADVRYVTFMSEDGSFEYGKKAVAVGDNCADPIARGVFSKPTKESTAQYTYTHYGWATTPNGAADPNWNKSITEDKTVYANFAAAVRYYTITYYDGDTVLKTETLAYGAMPNYIPEKKYHSFNGWDTELAMVTGDANYYAQFTMGLTFAGASWEDIAELSESGEAANVFFVGDEKVVPFTLADGTVENITVMIAGFNHDNLADGSGKAGMSIVCKTVPSVTVAYNSHYSLSSYNASDLKKTFDNLVSNLPDALSGIIKPVNKLCDASTSAGTSTTNVECDVWPLSLSELGWGYTTSTTYPPLGTKYDVFDTVGSTSNSPKYLPIFNVASTGKNALYWTRNLRRVGTMAPVYVTPSLDYTTGRTIGTTGDVQGANIPSKTYSLLFGFCI